MGSSACSPDILKSGKIIHLKIEINHVGRKFFSQARLQSERYIVAIPLTCSEQF